MKDLSKQLKQFLPNVPPGAERALSHAERKLFRALKSMGERATKGREIEKALYEVRFRGDTATLIMLLEGRHAMSVGRQIEKRFHDHRELEFASLVETKRGAKVVLRPRGEQNA